METDTAERVLKIRKIEDGEYDLLLKVQEGFRPDPKGSIALLAFDGKEIVGRMLLVSPPHVEGTWVKEEFRRGFTGMKLWLMMEEEARKIGLKAIFSYADNPIVEMYLKRLGNKQLPVSVWVKEL